MAIHKYSFASNARIPVSPQVAGEVCERIDREGRLTPKSLVDESRPTDAPLHKCFEWNDAIAAEKYRENQAGHIIRSLRIVPEGSRTKEPTKAFISIVTNSESGDQFQYKGIARVLKTREDREYMLISAKRELIAFQRKYSSLKELSDVFTEIENFVGSLPIDENAA